MEKSSFIKPQYDTTCFANLPQTVKYLLTGTGKPSLPPAIFRQLWRKYDTVLFFLIDAFGWRFFEKYQDYPFLKRIAEDGIITQLTAQFPSTTAAHVTCIHTGLAVGQSGVYEWQYYEPQLDAVITPLLFSFAGTTKQDTLKSENIDPKNLYPNRTIYQDLDQYGVTSHLFQHKRVARSTYSNIVFQGAKVVPYNTLPEALVNLQSLLAQAALPSYFFLYFGHIDAICHDYGPNSLQLEAEIDTLLTILDKWFLQKLRGKLTNTLFMMTADHGQVEVNPKTTIYLNLDPQFAGLQKYLKTNRAGELLVPGGSSRDVFLYVKDEFLTEASSFLSQRLAGKAEVYRVQDLIDRGFFGAEPVSQTFLSRVGNLVILPYAGESVWWYEKDMFEQKFYGHHGGLTRQEMEIPLMLYDFRA